MKEGAGLVTLNLFQGPFISQYFFSRDRKIFLGYGFVVPERAEAGREKFSPLAGLPLGALAKRGFLHMFDDLWNKFFILLFGVLFVEDAVGFVAETDAGEEMRGRVTIDTVGNKSIIWITKGTKEILIKIRTAIMKFITKI